MTDVAANRAGLLLAVALAVSGLGSAGAGSASAATGYRLAFGSKVDAAATGGPLIVKGHRAAPSDPMVADQIIKNVDGSTTTRAGMGQLIYEEYPGSVSHRHWHYKGFVRYQLRSVLDMSLVRPDNKAGFCLSDPDYATDFCGSQKPQALEVTEGLGPGTTDYYNPNLEGQWIDVQGVPPGEYWLLHWVNSAKEICESDYSNNAAAVKIALWPNGYGVAPYFAVKDTVAPFPSLYPDPSPPFDCDAGSSPTPKLPDLIQQAPGELSVTPIPDPPPPAGGQGGGPPPGSAAPVAPRLTKTFARRYALLALAQRFHRRARNARVACRRLSRTSFRCSARWRLGRYGYRGKLRIFTAPNEGGFERRFSLRVRRTDRVCAARHASRRCSRVVKATNVRFRRSLADVASRGVASRTP